MTGRPHRPGAPSTLTDAQWARIAPHVVGDARSRGRTGRDNRLFVEAVLWMVRTGAHWRDLPEPFGRWNSIFRRFRRWSLGGVWHRVIAAMADDPDFAYRIVAETLISTDPRAAGPGLPVPPPRGHSTPDARISDPSRRSGAAARVKI